MNIVLPLYNTQGNFLKSRLFLCGNYKRQNKTFEYFTSYYILKVLYIF